MRQLLLDHLHKYPLMQIQDCVKLLFQSRFGCGHFVSDPAVALARLQTELSGCSFQKDMPLFEPLGGGYCRLNLSALDPERLSLDTLARLFIFSSGQAVDGQDAFAADLSLLGEMIQNGELPFSAEDWKAFLNRYQADGYPAIGHSGIYREAYRPAYRVLCQSFWDYWSVFSAVDQLLRHRGGGIAAIDGGSGTGKSYLTQLLSAVFPAAAVHMDDFFLQGFQRTPQRLVEPGGNLDYERFLDQVVSHLEEKKAFSYEIFDCSCQKLSGQRAVENLPIRIVEGVYSLHPKWSGLFDLKIFLKASLPVRLKRIETRNGPLMCKRFQEEWIPKEDLYFASFSLPDQQTIVVDNDCFF